MKRKNWMNKEEVLQIVKKCLGFRFNTEAERYLEQIDVVVEVLSQVMEVDTIDKEINTLWMQNNENVIS